MQLVCTDPVRVASRAWPTMRSGWNLTVVCKATFLLLPGESQLHELQEPLHEHDRYWEDNRSRSLAVASDIVPYKPRADVVLVGSAHAPGRVPARSIAARFAVSGVDKSLEAFCDRAFCQDGQLRDGPWVRQVSLRYEHAAGGPDSWNPAGLRHDAPPDAYGMVPLPNLQPPGLHVRRREDVIAPIGFGPIAPSWPWRQDRLGQHAGTWAPERWWCQPLPSGFDPAFFNVAPGDQQVAELRENEGIVLENLHPEHQRLMTTLPGARPRAVVERDSPGREEVKLVCDTLWIDTDRGVATLVWRGRVALAHAKEPGRVVVSLEWAPSSMRAYTRGAAAERRANTESGGPAADAAGTVSAQLDEEAEESDATRTVAGSVTAEHAPVLPFANAASSATHPGSEPASAQGWGVIEARIEGLPFVPPTGARPPAVALLDAGAPVSTTSAPVPPLVVSRPPMLDPIAPPATSPTWPGMDLAAQPTQKASIGQLAAGKIPASAQEPLVVKPEALAGLAAGSIDDAAAKRGWKPVGSGEGKGAGDAPPLMSAAAVAAGVASSSPAMRAGRFTEPIPARPPELSPATSAPKAVVELLWHDPAFVPRIRRQPGWREIMAQVKPNPKDDDYPGDAPPEKRNELRDRREVFGLLARAVPTDLRGIDAAVANAVREDGTFLAPLVLVAGELEFPFDELETLKATIAAVMPFVAGDKKLKETVETTEQLLQTPWLKGANSIAEGLTQKLREAFAQGNRALPARYLESHTERMLLEQRAYQKRTVLGKPCLRSLLTTPRSAEQLPVYLPESLKQELPAFLKLGVKMIAEARTRLDQYESHATALHSVVLGRVLERPWR